MFRARIPPLVILIQKKGHLSTVVLGCDGAKGNSTGEPLLGGSLPFKRERGISSFLKGIGGLASSLLYLTCTNI